jgi:hypothetical protein
MFVKYIRFNGLSALADKPSSEIVRYIEGLLYALLLSAALNTYKDALVE